MKCDGIEFSSPLGTFRWNDAAVGSRATLKEGEFSES